MPKVIRHFETKEGRKKEREKVGKLQDAIVKPITTERYHQMFQQFLSFTNLTKARMHADPNVVDPVLADFIESLWCDGEPNSYANYAVAAVQFYVPECKRHLTRSWKLVSTWNKIEMRARVVPISAEVLLAIAGVFQKWQWRRLSLMLVVAYSTFLRTGEIFRIRRENVVLGHHGHPAVIFLQDTKETDPVGKSTGKRTLGATLSGSTLPGLAKTPAAYPRVDFSVSKNLEGFH